jgi:AraC family transcriptional regulator, regulatory protein of adaptative response / methylated-DNA-[protein]-cysteine methyltransferase
MMPNEVSWSDEQAWQAVVSRNESFDGRLFFGVLTTGVYCRPSCPARQPLRRNVRFYATPADAERDGLRPCLRCRPLATAGLDPHTDCIREICRYIEEHTDDALSLTDLARRAALSKHHFQRTFKAIVGVTPKEYVEAHRVKRLKQNLRTGRHVTEAIYETGFGSSSRVYERSGTRLGMTPRQYRQGGRRTAISYVSAETALGKLMVGATDRGICFVQFGDHEEPLVAELTREYPNAEIAPAPEPLHPDLKRWMTALRDYLAGQQPNLHLPLDIRATAFQMKVWKYLQSIPYGSVESYGEVAAGIGQPTAVRAVARACATNRVALIIPCHRVIRNTGGLGGYRWGLPRKRTLIDRERATRGAFAPTG